MTNLIITTNQLEDLARNGGQVKTIHQLLLVIAGALTWCEIVCMLFLRDGL